MFVGNVVLYRVCPLGPKDGCLRGIMSADKFMQFIHNSPCLDCGIVSSELAWY